VSLAQRVLVEEHGVGSLSDLSLTILVFVFVFLHLRLRDDLFVVQVHVEQDLALVLFQ